MTLRSILAASLLLLPLLATAHNFVDGQRVAPVGVADRGELILDKDKFSYKNWNSAQLAGKVRVVQHIAGRSSAKEKNANLIEAIKAAGFPHDRYQTTTSAHCPSRLDRDRSHRRASLIALVGMKKGSPQAAFAWLVRGTGSAPRRA